MARGKWAGRVDDNQQQIVKDLRDMGYSVALRHDDIIVGAGGQNFWFEIKNPERCFLADGATFRKGAIKESQTKIRRTWLGQYDVVTSTEQIVGIINKRLKGK